MKRSKFLKFLPVVPAVVTVLTIAVVFFRNMFPPLDDMIVFDDLSKVRDMDVLEDSSSAVMTNSLNISETRSDSSSGSSPALSGSDREGSLSFKSELAGGKININTASVTELMTLIGIGETRAKAIVEYRTVNGEFSSIDDLLKVNGIGEKTLEKNRDLIIV